MKRVFGVLISCMTLVCLANGHGGRLPIRSSSQCWVLPNLGHSQYEVYRDGRRLGTYSFDGARAQINELQDRDTCSFQHGDRFYIEVMGIAQESLAATKSDSPRRLMPEAVQTATLPRSAIQAPLTKCIVQPLANKWLQIGPRYVVLCPGAAPVYTTSGDDVRRLVASLESTGHGFLQNDEYKWIVSPNKSARAAFHPFNMPR